MNTEILEQAPDGWLNSDDYARAAGYNNRARIAPLAQAGILKAVRVRARRGNVGWQWYLAPPDQQVAPEPVPAKEEGFTVLRQVMAMRGVTEADVQRLLAPPPTLQGMLDDLVGKQGRHAALSTLTRLVMEAEPHQPDNAINMEYMQRFDEARDLLMTRNSELNTARAEVERLKQEMAKHQEELQGGRQTYQAQARMIDEQRAKIQSLERNIDQRGRELADLRTELANQNERVFVLNNQLSAAEQLLGEATNHPQLQQQLELVTLARDNHAEECVRLRAALNEANQQLDAMTSKVSELAQEVESQRLMVIDTVRTEGRPVVVTPSQMRGLLVALKPGHHMGSGHLASNPRDPKCVADTLRKIKGARHEATINWLDKNPELYELGVEHGFATDATGGGMFRIGDRKN